MTHELFLLGWRMEDVKSAGDALSGDFNDADSIVSTLSEPAFAKYEPVELPLRRTSEFCIRSARKVNAIIDSINDCCQSISIINPSLPLLSLGPNSFLPTEIWQIIGFLLLDFGVEHYHGELSA